MVTTTEKRQRVIKAANRHGISAVARALDLHRDPVLTYCAGMRQPRAFVEWIESRIHMLDALDVRAT